MKEIIISAIIVVVIIVGDILTGNFIDNKLDHIVGLLDEITPLLENEDYDGAEEKIRGINEYFDESEAMLSCYIEHDELEKVKTDIVNLNAYIKLEDDEAYTKAKEMSFIIKHIEEKDDLKVKNIF